MLRMTRAVNLVVSGLLVGNEFATWAVVHRAVRKLPLADQVTLEQELTRRYLLVMPVLMTGTVASSGALAVALPAVHPTARRLTMAGTTCFTAMLAVTLAGNMPLNAATLRATPDVDGDEWQRLRRRWDRLHSVRVALDVAGLLLTVAGVVEQG